MIHHETIIKDAIANKKESSSHHHNVISNLFFISILPFSIIAFFYLLDLISYNDPANGLATVSSMFIYKIIALTTLPADIVIDGLFFFGFTTFGLFYIPLLIYIAYLNIKGPDSSLKREGPWMIAFIKAFIFYLVYCIFIDLGNLFYLVNLREVNNVIIQPTSLSNVYITMTKVGIKASLIPILLLLNYGIRRPFNINKGQSNVA